MEETKDLGGRPTIYTSELGGLICARLAEGESLRHIVNDESMPSSSTIYRWLLQDDKKEFWEQYTTARNIQAEQLFEELLELADESVEDIVGDDKSDGARVQARKLQVDTRKWFLSKVLPKKFGDKMDVTSGNKPIPLLHVLNNNSGKEDTQPEEAN